jgi:hypothetical protein
MTVFSGSFFKRHPEKVLGKIVTHNPNTGKVLTNAFGKPQPEVRGSLENVINGIDVAIPIRFEHFREPTPVTKVTDQIEPEKDIDRLARAIAKTRQQQNSKSSGAYDLRPLSETIKSYNTDIEYTDFSKDLKGVRKKYTISDEELKVWVTYQTIQGLFDQDTISKNAWGEYYITNPDWMKWFNQSLVCFDGNHWIPSSLFYSGNIYDQVAGMKKNKEIIVATIGEEGYSKQLAQLEASKPLQLLITEDENRKLYLSPFHKIWSEIKISELSDGTILKDNYSIGTIFYQHYLADLPEEDFIHERKSTSAYEIFNYFIEKRNFPRNRYTDQEKAAIKQNQLWAAF